MYSTTLWTRRLERCTLISSAVQGASTRIIVLEYAKENTGTKATSKNVGNLQINIVSNFTTTYRRLSCLCGLTLHQNTGLPVNISSRDRNFLYQAINSDLQVREIELKDRAKLANTPHVVIQRDYTTSQVECRVIPMAEFDRDGINDDRWSAAFARVFARPPEKLVLCCAIIPRGSQPYKMLWFEDVEDITISTRVGRWTSRPVGRSQFY